MEFISEYVQAFAILHEKNGVHKSLVTSGIKFIVIAVTLSFIHIGLTLRSRRFNSEVERKWRNTETSFYVNKTHLFFSICQQFGEGKKDIACVSL